MDDTKLSFFLLVTIEPVDKTWLNDHTWKRDIGLDKVSREVSIGSVPKLVHSHVTSVATVDLPFLATLIDDLLVGHMTIH